MDSAGGGSLTPTAIVATSGTLDAGTGTLTLTLTTLSLGATLNVWDWNTAQSGLFVTNGIVLGNASQILFYSDTGQIFLGHGQLTGTQITVVPEPSPASLALAGLFLVALFRRCRRRGA